VNTNVFPTARFRIGRIVTSESAVVDLAEGILRLKQQ
jgi:hypothetical protein